MLVAITPRTGKLLHEVELWPELSEDLSRVQLHQEVEPVFAYVRKPRPQGSFEHRRRAFDGPLRLCRKVHLDQVAPLLGGEGAASGHKPRGIKFHLSTNKFRQNLIEGYVRPLPHFVPLPPASPPTPSSPRRRRGTEARGGRAAPDRSEPRGSSGGSFEAKALIWRISFTAHPRPGKRDALKSEGSG